MRMPQASKLADEINATPGFKVHWFYRLDNRHQLIGVTDETNRRLLYVESPSHWRTYLANAQPQAVTS